MCSSMGSGRMSQGFWDVRYICGLVMRVRGGRGTLGADLQVGVCHGGHMHMRAEGRAGRVCTILHQHTPMTSRLLLLPSSARLPW